MAPIRRNRYPDASHKVDARISEWAKRVDALSYAEGVADADRRAERLIDWASKRKRKTVIAFFGDTSAAARSRLCQSCGGAC